MQKLTIEDMEILEKREDVSKVKFVQLIILDSLCGEFRIEYKDGTKESVIVE